MTQTTTHHATRARRALSAAGVFLCSLALAFALALPQAQAVTSADKRAEAAKLMEQIDGVQARLNEANAALGRAESERKAAQDGMARAEAERKAAEERTREMQGRLSNRARSIYRHGVSGFVDVLLGSTSFEQFAIGLVTMERVAERDGELIGAAKSAREAAAQARKTYEEQEAKAHAAEDAARTERDRIDAAHRELKEKIDRVNAEADRLHAEEEARAEEARRAREAAQAAEAALSANRAPGVSVVAGNGTFAHPCPAGTVSSPFGYRDFDHSFHKGVDFAAPEGTPYYAAASGTVIIAGSSASAGNWIVISHGNGLITKYMHSSALFVHAGDHVEKGQNIGLVGNTGNSFGAHLHFQVEVNAGSWSGTAVNPFLYL